MDSQAEEPQDTDTNREAMCVTIKEWPLDSLRGCQTGPLRLRVASGSMQNEGQRWEVAAFALVFPYRLFNKMCPSRFNVCHLLQLNEESSEVHRRAAMLGREICVANWDHAYKKVTVSFTDF